VARFLIVAACLTCLAGCSSATKLSDLWPPNNSDASASEASAADSGGFKLSDLWKPKGSDAASDSPAANSGEQKMNNLWTPKNSDGSKWGVDNSDGPTGSVSVTPAEAGPGAPVAPLAKPGLLGGDPHDDLQLAKKYFRANNYGLAEKAFRSAVEQHPHDAEAWVGLAASYDRLHRFDLADRAYQEAIRLVGRTPEILNNLGFSYLLRGDYARAQKIFREALIKDPANPYIQANLRLLEESGREGKAVQ